MFDRFISRVSEPSFCSADANAAPSAGDGVPAPPPAPPPSPTAAPPAAVLLPAAALPQADKPPKPFELPDVLKKLANDPNYFTKEARSNKLAELKAIGVKIPKKIRESGTYEQIMKEASRKISRFKSRGRDVIDEAKLNGAEARNLSTQVARLAAQVATFPTFVDAQLAGMPKAQRDAVSKAYAHIVDPIDRANAMLQFLSAQEYARAASQPASTQPTAASQAEIVPPPAPAAAAAAAAASKPPPLPAPATTSNPGGPPPPPPGGGPSVPQHYRALRDAAYGPTGGPRERAALRLFVSQHAREIQTAAQTRAP